MLFLHKFLTLLTPTREVPFSALIGTAAISSPFMESAEKREVVAEAFDLIASCLGLGGPEPKLRLLSLDENRPKGSGDNGMTGELSLRPGGEVCDLLSPPTARCQICDSLEAASLGSEVFLAIEALGVEVWIPLRARRGGEGGTFDGWLDPAVPLWGIKVGTAGHEVSVSSNS